MTPQVGLKAGLILQPFSTMAAGVSGLSVTLLVVQQLFARHELLRTFWIWAVEVFAVRMVIFFVVYQVSLKPEFFIASVTPQTLALR